MSEEKRYFEGVLEDGKIYERTFDRKTPQIGVALEVYDELVKEHEDLITSYNEYQELLIKHGLIDVPKSPEEQIKEFIEASKEQTKELTALVKRTSEALVEQYKLIEGLQADISELKRGFDERIESDEVSEGSGGHKSGNTGSGKVHQGNSRKFR